jgi:hypothetical protein
VAALVDLVVGLQTLLLVVEVLAVSLLEQFIWRQQHTRLTLVLVVLVVWILVAVMLDLLQQ